MFHVCSFLCGICLPDRWSTATDDSRLVEFVNKDYVQIKSNIIDSRLITHHNPVPLSPCQSVTLSSSAITLGGIIELTFHAKSDSVGVGAA